MRRPPPAPPPPAPMRRVGPVLPYFPAWLPALPLVGLLLFGLARLLMGYPDPGCP